MYKLFEINALADTTLAKEIPAEYQPNAVISRLKNGLSSNVAHILLEHPYVDKDYRSTYYNYYSKKNLSYSPHSVRIHFFSKGVQLQDGYRISSTDGEDITNKYLGFVTLRPTRLYTIGRSAISPKAIKHDAGRVMLAKHKVHFLGQRFTVNAFPWMEQPADIAVCAHVACWSILRFYSERFTNHRDFLLHEITKMASPVDPGGMLPSRGLYVGQAARILAEGGVYPDIYGEIVRDGDHQRFLRTLFAYVESGLPVFVAIKGHALAVVGHGEISIEKLTDEPTLREFPTCKLRFCFDGISGLIVADDAALPYTTMPRKNGTNAFSVEGIHTFVVPLPDKIYLHADAVEEYACSLFENDQFDLDLDKNINPVFRYFLTTSSSLQAWYHDHSNEYDPAVIAVLVDFALPRFVWVVEVGPLTEWGLGECNSRLILDATASPHELQPFILLHSAKKAVVYNRSCGGDAPCQITLSAGKQSFTQFNRNLDVC